MNLPQNINRKQHVWKPIEIMKLIKSFNMKIRNTVTTIAFAAGMAVLIQVQTAQAQAVFRGNLGALATTPGATLTIDDKTFSNFGYLATGADASELNTDAAGLQVTASSVGGVDYLDFGGLIAVNNLVGTSTLLGDLKLTYTVTANPGSISMIDQNYTPNALPSGGQIIIDETVAVPGGATVASSTLTLNPLVLSQTAGPNLIVNPSEQQLLVTKDIFIGALAGQLVGLSDVEQSFHQLAVPEPASVGLFLTGLGALVCCRRFIRNRSS
jgi:hypothetical protein